MFESASGVGAGGSANTPALSRFHQQDSEAEADCSGSQEQHEADQEHRDSERQQLETRA
jgi:hypothetical protein